MTFQRLARVLEGRVESSPPVYWRESKGNQSCSPYRTELRTRTFPATEVAGYSQSPFRGSFVVKKFPGDPTCTASRGKARAHTVFATPTFPLAVMLSEGECPSRNTPALVMRKRTVRRNSHFQAWCMERIGEIPWNDGDAPETQGSFDYADRFASESACSAQDDIPKD